MARTRSRLALCCLLLILWLVAPAEAQYWRWSQPKPYHKAVVVVRASDGQGMRITTGTIIHFRGLCGVLTCAHGLTGQEATVKLQDGRTVRARCTVDKNGLDIGFVLIPCQKHLPHIPVAWASPQPGDTVEFVTFGGPETRLRHWLARVAGSRGTKQEYSTYVVHGDSGGAILNTKGELVGVQSYGIETVFGSYLRVPVYRGAGGECLPRIRSFLQRVLQRFGGS